LEENSVEYRWANHLELAIDRVFDAAQDLRDAIPIID
jgi:hypothetical protein